MSRCYGAVVNVCLTRSGTGSKVPGPDTRCHYVVVVMLHLHAHVSHSSHRHSQAKLHNLLHISSSDHSVYQCACRQSGCAAFQELLSLSDAQMQDFAHLRHLYLTKRALLAFERKKLVNQMQESDSVLPHPADGQLEVSELAAKLRQNAADDYEVYIKLGYAVRRGVSYLCQSVLVTWLACSDSIPMTQTQRSI